MAKINWENQHVTEDPFDDRYEIVPDRENLFLNYTDFKQEGFKYVPYDSFYLHSAHVILPSGMKMYPSEIKRTLSEKLVTGNKRQVEALNALEFFKLAEMFE